MINTIKIFIFILPWLKHIPMVMKYIVKYIEYLKNKKYQNIVIIIKILIFFF